MLAEYKGKWFNPELIESIRIYLSGNSVIHEGMYKRQIYISIYISGSGQISIPTEIYCDNKEIDKCKNQEYMNKLGEKDLNKLAAFINKHCKENKCKN